MSDEDQASDVEKRAAARRRFLKTASQVAVTTPAVTLLLAAGTKSGARAGIPYFCVVEGDDSLESPGNGFCDGGSDADSDTDGTSRDSEGGDGSNVDPRS